MHEDAGHGRNAGRNRAHEGPGPPVQEQAGDEEQEDIVIEVEDDGAALLGDFANQIRDPARR